MARKSNWNDEYWLLLMQLYLRKPVGMKPLYSKEMVDLSLELHIPPTSLRQRMAQIDTLQTPRIERFWQRYGNSPRRLGRAVSLLRSMKGYGNADEFYEGVEVQETFERDFRPVAEGTMITPVMLVLILDLYFRLTPLTMAAETPEVQELSQLMGLSAGEVVEALQAFRHCDPYNNRRTAQQGWLADACQQTWNRFGNSDTEQLAALAAELKEYFK